MGILSLHFFLFSGAVLLVYYVLPSQKQNYWLLLASYFFYLTWAWEFALTLAILTLITYFTALRMGREDGQRTGTLWLGIGFNLVALLFFRLNEFFLPEFLEWISGAGAKFNLTSLNWIIPVGLSFYILQNISYLVDVSRKQILPSTNLVDFGLYLAYFPKLVAGPIERARTFLPKLARPRIVYDEQLARSLVLIIVGLLRKVVIADSLLAGTPGRILEQPIHYSAIELWGWLVIYAFALYNDFAGYTSIVRGVSGLFGIELSPNFNLPYFSHNFSEFWGRWHMTLSLWLRDYLFSPLTRSLMRRTPNRQNLLVVWLPPLVTMLISGLWHGIGWNMVLWGAVYGVYLSAQRLLSLRQASLSQARLPGARPFWRQGLSMLLTFGLVTLAWVPFRLELPAALQYWQGLFRWEYMGMAYPRELKVGLVFLVPIILLDWLQWRYQDEVFIFRWPRLIQAVVLASVLFLIFLGSALDGAPPFVYQGF